MLVVMTPTDWHTCTTQSWFPPPLADFISFSLEVSADPYRLAAVVLWCGGEVVSWCNLTHVDTVCGLITQRSSHAQHPASAHVMSF
jgi:hypothetical protein